MVRGFVCVLQDEALAHNVQQGSSISLYYHNSTSTMIY